MEAARLQHLAGVSLLQTERTRRQPCYRFSIRQQRSETETRAGN